MHRGQDRLGDEARNTRRRLGPNPRLRDALYKDVCVKGDLCVGAPHEHPRRPPAADRGSAPNGMDFYAQSNHRRHCLYEAEKLGALRRDANRRARERLPAGLEALDPAEELLVLRHYHTKIPEICRYFKFPVAVQLTAHWALMRFYLRHSMMEFDPKHVMLAAVLLATKCANLHLTMDDFAARLPNTSAELLTRLEFFLLAALDYTLYFFSPMDALAGWLLDWRTWCAAQAAPCDDHVLAAPAKLIHTICTTDALLLYSPAILALVALRVAASTDAAASGTSLADYLAARLALARCASDLSETTLDAAQAAVEGLLAGCVAAPADAALVKAIDRRLIQIRKL